MKKNLPIFAATIFAIASNANANPQYYYQNAYNPYANPYNNSAATYNNMEPASGRSGAAATSNWPYWYLGLNAGVAINSSADWDSAASSGDFDNDTAFGYSATIGYQPSEFRYELELGMANHEIGEASTNTGDVDATKLMANVIYDFGRDAYSPFLGAGLGGVKVDVSPSNNASVDGADTALAYQLIGGLNFGSVLPQTDFSVAYKYLDTFSDLKEDGVEFEYNAHTIEAGAKFRF